MLKGDNGVIRKWAILKLVNWHKIEGYTTTSLPEAKPLEVMVGKKRVGLVKKQDKIHAYAALCPHAGAPLCDGWLDPLGRLVCPLHKYRFDPANGRNTTGEGYKLYTYQLEIRGEEIWVGLPL